MSQEQQPVVATQAKTIYTDCIEVVWMCLACYKCVRFSPVGVQQKFLPTCRECKIDATAIGISGDRKSLITPIPEEAKYTHLVNGCIEHCRYCHSLNWTLWNNYEVPKRWGHLGQAMHSCGNGYYGEIDIMVPAKSAVDFAVRYGVQLISSGPEPIRRVFRAPVGPTEVAKPPVPSPADKVETKPGPAAKVETKPGPADKTALLPAKDNHAKALSYSSEITEAFHAYIRQQINNNMGDKGITRLNITIPNIQYALRNFPDSYRWAKACLTNEFKVMLADLTTAGYQWILKYRDGYDGWHDITPSASTAAQSTDKDFLIVYSDSDQVPANIAPRNRVVPEGFSIIPKC